MVRPRRPRQPCEGGVRGRLRRQEDHLAPAGHEGRELLGVAAGGERRLPEHQRRLVERRGGEARGVEGVDRGRQRLLRRDPGRQREHPAGRRILGDHDGAARRRLVVHEVKLVVGRVGVGGDRHPAEAAGRPAAGQRDRVALHHRLAADQFDLDRRARAADLQHDRHGARRAVPGAGERHGEHERPLAAARLDADAAHPDGEIVGVLPGKRDQLQPHRLRQPGEGLADRRPGRGVDGPVVPPLVGADPDLGAAVAPVADLPLRLGEQPGDVGGGGPRARGRQLPEPCRRPDLDGGVGAVDQQAPVRRQRGQRVGHLPPRGVELRGGGGRAPLLHRRRAVEDHQRRVGPGAARQRQPAA